MARVLISNKSPFYSVDQGVGRQGPNIRQDVLLVQFLLSLITGPGSFLPLEQSGAPARGPGVLLSVKPKPNEPPRIPGGLPIVIDGVCGPQTISFIEYFQGLIPYLGMSVSNFGWVTGQVNPGYGTTQSIMNAMLKYNADTWNLLNTVGFPAELKVLFYG